MNYPTPKDELERVREYIEKAIRNLNTNDTN